MRQTFTAFQLITEARLVSISF